MQMTLSFDPRNADEVDEVHELLTQIRDQLFYQVEPIEGGPGKHVRMLLEFEAGLTTKQREVWDYMLAHPGYCWADELKAVIPDLRVHGSLPGVFKATQRWKRLGGSYETSPFSQISYLRERGGQYRGLSDEEIAEMKKFRRA